MAERAYDRDPTTGGGFLGIDPGMPLPGESASLPGLGQSEWDRAGVDRTVGVSVGGPQYTAQHKWLLANMPIEHLVRLQETMEQVGFSRKMKLGVLDDATVDNWVELLGLANREGSDWQSTLGRLGDYSGGMEAVKEELPEFEPATFVAADPVAMAQDVKDLMKQRLGREPRPDEIDELVTEMGGISRLRHEQDEELRELQFNAQVDPEGEVQAPEEFTKIDPSARFRKLFEEKYGGEIEHKEEVAEVASQRESLESQVAATDRYVRG